MAIQQGSTISVLGTRNFLPPLPDLVLCCFYCLFLLALFVNPSCCFFLLPLHLSVLHNCSMNNVNSYMCVRSF